MKFDINIESDFYILEPYKLDKNRAESSFQLNNDDTECLGKILSKNRNHINTTGQLAVGDIVMYDIRYAMVYDLQGKRYIIIKQDDIIAKIKQEENDG